MSAAPRSQATSSAPSIERRRRLRDGLKRRSESTSASTSFVNGPDIPDTTSAATEPPETGFALWRGHRRRSGIKDSTPAARSLSEYTWEVLLCMVLTGEGRLGPDIWPEAADQAESTEDMMRRVWATEAHVRRRASGTTSIPLSSSGKEARHVSPLTSYHATIMLLIEA